MRAIEQAAIDSGQVSGLELMQRAGRGAVAAILDHWQDMQATPHRAVILCGPGNNGGDGFVVACDLAARGWAVELFLYGDPERLPPDALAMHDAWARLGTVHRLSFPHPTEAEMQRLQDHASSMPEILSAPEDGSDAPPQPPFLLVDALFGIGLSRPLVALEDLLLHIDYLSTFPSLNTCRIVAIDVPSGLDADTGLYVMDEEKPGMGGVQAHLTVTFHCLKPGHVSGIGPKVCGVVTVVDIGLGGEA